MEDINFSIYKDSSIQTISCQDLLKNKQVLICSVTRQHEMLTLYYIKHLVEQQEKFKIDICVLFPSGSNFSLARIDRLYPSILALVDNNNRFAEYLSSYCNKPTGFSHKFWNYQVLFNNVTIEQFYEQPTENQTKELLKAKRDDTEFMRKFRNFYISKSEQEIFDKIKLLNPEQYYDCGGQIFYYNLWPKVQLEKYLLDKQVDTAV